MLSPHTAFASVSATPEPFVSAEEAARFLSIKRRFLLSLARRGIGGAYALSTGELPKPGCSGSRNLLRPSTEGV